MQVVVGEFGTQTAAEGALVRLHSAGYSADQTALVDNISVDDTGSNQAGDAATTNGGDGGVLEAGTSGAGSTQGKVSRPVVDNAGVAPAVTPVVTAPTMNEEVHLPSEPDTPPQLTSMGQREDQAVENTALGGALGAFAGGAVAGPLGIALGVVAGSAIGAWVSRWRDSNQEVRSSMYPAAYLVAVEVDGPAAEVHRLMGEAGALRVHVEPL